MASSDFRLDKTAFSVVSLDQADDDVAYWLSKTPEERLRAVEFLRQTHYGYDSSTARMQKVLSIVKLGELE